MHGKNSPTLEKIGRMKDMYQKLEHYVLIWPILCLLIRLPKGMIYIKTLTIINFKIFVVFSVSSASIIHFTYE